MNPYLLLTWYESEGARREGAYPVDRITDALEHWRQIVADEWRSGATLSLVTPIARKAQP